ncbi:MAG: hypothetical protein KH321_04830 [Clostridium sp.]|jgi:hypothetical protein|nr:hypothetical protein [Clostridium sp.]
MKDLETLKTKLDESQRNISLASSLSHILENLLQDYCGDITPKDISDLGIVITKILIKERSAIDKISTELFGV